MRSGFRVTGGVKQVHEHGPRPDKLRQRARKERGVSRRDRGLKCMRANVMLKGDMVKEEEE